MALLPNSAMAEDEIAPRRRTLSLRPRPPWQRRLAQGPSIKDVRVHKNIRILNPLPLVRILNCTQLYLIHATSLCFFNSSLTFSLLMSFMYGPQGCRGTCSRSDYSQIP